MGNNPKFKDVKGDSIFVYFDYPAGKYSAEHLLKIIGSTDIGNYALETFRGSKSRHLHITFADLKAVSHAFDDNYGANGVTYTGNTKPWFQPGELLGSNIQKTYNINATEINPAYIEGIKFRKGRNQIVLLEINSKNSEQRQVQTLFHEIFAHAKDPNSKNQHLRFSGDKNGHFNPETLRPPYSLDAFPLNIFFELVI